MVEFLERHDFASADFGFELTLAGLKESFDQSARLRLARRTVQEFDVQLRAGQLECVGVVDLGVIDVQLSASALVAPGSQKRIGQNVEVLANVVTRFDDKATLTVDPGGQVRLDHLALLDDRRPVFKVADPQRTRLFTRPTATDLLRGDAQLASCRPFALQMMIERAARERASELALEDAVNDFVGAVRLFLLELHGASQ